MTRDVLIGFWRAVRRGESLNRLEDADFATSESFTFRDDGTMDFIARHAITGERLVTECTWDIVDNTDLVITVPVAAMPDVGIDEPTSEDVWFRIIRVDGRELTLDSRPCGGEVITV